MTYDEFKNVVHNRFSACEDILTAKSHEYAPNQDRLEQFKITATMQECTPIRSLGGMMVKHTSTLHQFMNDPEKYSQAQWEEKIADTINYCLLLEGLLVEMWSIKEYMESMSQPIARFYPRGSEELHHKEVVE